ncbi:MULTISPECIES: hypothetical protein [Nocardiopsis]|uniref:Uncharacterized protein n=1 Tax=Nocardiopsis dassonvillei (strain ATCC 23218 / DSM 43111 / CIP 107115 / JCM 7437 / KCTC 9190 / NBRC 14626 / NCTC 10488 / NRRL B-5397 / IMRU 509) TaxID=446468 RepID=D7AYN7_NOCDD|nr:hypothetical protein [Nocardiopsis dassonvillei]ADH68049.1 hypothetical protein Ndas_2632 [Nocardiopsis dassonvillei subsp. dassonvillei DSM 43111]APC36193.1 hypothetical protein A9R04_16510 [Nocardiopsis dassonvillei]NKY81465.1 hypothetical protein [Nocardiopsis dassonvillei]VEI88548.1 Uncharacterised protein [Nocardiopsis dassonvillei]
MPPEIMAAHRVLLDCLFRGGRIEDHRADMETAGAAFMGVLSAFFRNVMEYAFSGHEPGIQVREYLEDLKRCYPYALDSLEPVRTAVFVLEQIGPEAPPPGQSYLLTGPNLVGDMATLALYTAKQEGLSEEQLEMYLFGATARYMQGM